MTEQREDEMPIPGSVIENPARPGWDVQTEDIIRKNFKIRLEEMGRVAEGFQIVAYFGHRVIADNRIRHYMVCRWRPQMPWKLEIRDEYYSKFRGIERWIWRKPFLTLDLEGLELLDEEQIIPKAIEKLRLLNRLEREALEKMVPQAPYQHKRKE